MVWPLDDTIGSSSSASPGVTFSRLIAAVPPLRPLPTSLTLSFNVVSFFTYTYGSNNMTGQRSNLSPFNTFMLAQFWRGSMSSGKSDCVHVCVAAASSRPSSFFEVIPVDPVFEDATLAGVSANLLPCVRWHGVVRSTIQGCTPRTVSGLTGAGCIVAFECIVRCTASANSRALAKSDPHSGKVSLKIFMYRMTSSAVQDGIS